MQSGSEKEGILNRIRIMMFGRPGGTLGFTLDQHILGLNSDEKNRFHVREFDESISLDELSQCEVFWFYAKAFDPSIYQKLKSFFSDRKFVVGPNVLLDKPDVGPCDQWDEWLINEAEFDLHLDQVKFYNEHVKKFFPEAKKLKSTYLDKCMRLEIFDHDVDVRKRNIDCLVYSKKRRYDHSFEKFREQILEGIESRKINYRELTYGSYKKEDFLDTLLSTKIMLNLSLDECPGILNYEAFYCNTPVIGSPNNVPSTFDQNFWVPDTDRMTEKYLVRDPDSSRHYLKKLDDFLEGGLKMTKSPRDFVLNHTSYQRYCDDVSQIFRKYFQWD